jgi:hypothetical protein
LDSAFIPSNWFVELNICGDVLSFQNIKELIFAAQQSQEKAENLYKRVSIFFNH